MSEQTEGAEVCGARYGQNPDACYQPEGHNGTHSNQWGTTWADPAAARGVEGGAR